MYATERTIILLALGYGVVYMDEPGRGSLREPFVPVRLYLGLAARLVRPQEHVRLHRVELSLDSPYDEVSYTGCMVRLVGIFQSMDEQGSVLHERHVPGELLDLVEVLPSPCNYRYRYRLLLVYLYHVIPLVEW